MPGLPPGIMINYLQITTIVMTEWTWWKSYISDIDECETNNGGCGVICKLGNSMLLTTFLSRHKSSTTTYYWSWSFLFVICRPQHARKLVLQVWFTIYIVKCLLFLPDGLLWCPCLSVPRKQCKIVKTSSTPEAYSS